MSDQPSTAELIRITNERDAWARRAETAEAALDAARRTERERCAQIAENGHFLTNTSLEAQFGKACAAAIRSDHLPAVRSTAEEKT